MAEENTTSQPAKNQNPLIVFLIFIIVVGLLALAFFFGLKYRQIPGKVVPTPTPEVTNIPSPQPTPTPMVDESELIKQAVYKKTGLTENKALVTISKNTGEFATGGIKEYEAVGGAYWLAAKTDEGWVCVYDGQSQPTCEQIALYNFPKDMVPECLDENGKVIKR